MSWTVRGGAIASGGPGDVVPRGAVASGGTGSVAARGAVAARDAGGGVARPPARPRRWSLDDPGGADPEGAGRAGDGPGGRGLAGGPPAGFGPVPLGACAACDRISSVPAGAPRPEVTSPEAAAGLLVPRLTGADRERCLSALLDTKHRLLAVALVSIGSLDHTFMAPREVFRDALLANAAALVLAHNHPSGDPTPSRDDESVTRRLQRAGELVGIDVLDHLVVGGERWVSLARRGVLPG